MAKILATHHGFKCTVLFAIDPKDGTINPNIAAAISNAPGLDGASPEDRCAGCDVAPGGLHHLGCDFERCPSCGQQASVCGFRV